MHLEGLPFDVFHQIAASLDDRDYINLSRSCRLLHGSMKSELIARKTAEVSFVALRADVSTQLTPHRMPSYTARKAGLP